MPESKRESLKGRRTKQHSEANDTPQVSIPLVKKKSNIILILHPIVALKSSVIQWKLVRAVVLFQRSTMASESLAYAPREQP
jgi:hypothetical protein